MGRGRSTSDRGRIERRAGRGLSGANGHGDRAVRRRRTGRYHRADRRRHLLASSRPEIRGGECRRRRRHHRRAARRARRRRRLHHPVRSRRHQCAGGGVLSQPRLRSAEGFRADRTDRPNIRNCWWCARIFPPTISRNSSPTPRPTKPSSMSAMPGSARCPISAACCSMRRSASSRRWCRSPARRRC